MLRTPCVTRRIDQEPLDETILQQYSEKLDKNLRFYLYDFGNPLGHHVFNHTIISHPNDNKFVSPKSLQKRIFISNHPTFIYLQKGHSATFLCPKLPPPFLPVTWHKLIKGRYLP